MMGEVVSGSFIPQVVPGAFIPFNTDQLHSIKEDITAVREIFTSQYKASLKESQRQKTVNAIELFNARNREANKNVEAIWRGQGYPVFKSFAEFNETTGGALRYLVDQSANVLHRVDPGSMALINASLGTAAHGVHMAIPQEAMQYIAETYKSLMGNYPTENQRFLVNSTGGAIAGQFINGGVNLMMREVPHIPVPKPLSNTASQRLNVLDVARGESFKSSRGNLSEIEFRKQNLNNLANPNLTDYMRSSDMQHFTALEGADCSEIAEKILNQANGRGRILEIKPNKPNSLNLFENGKETGAIFTYHQIYTDGMYVYDPRLSSTPVPKGDWEKLMKTLNPEGMMIKKVK